MSMDQQPPQVPLPLQEDTTRNESSINGSDDKKTERPSDTNNITFVILCICIPTQLIIYVLFLSALLPDEATNTGTSFLFWTSFLGTLLFSIIVMISNRKSVAGSSRLRFWIAFSGLILVVLEVVFAITMFMLFIYALVSSGGF